MRFIVAVIWIFRCHLSCGNTVNSIFSKDPKKGVGAFAFNSYKAGDFKKKSWVENEFGFVKKSYQIGAKFKRDARYEDKDFITFFGSYKSKWFWYFKTPKTTFNINNTIRSLAAGATEQAILEAISSNVNLYSTIDQIENNISPSKPDVECFKKPRNSITSIDVGDRIYCEVSATRDITALNNDITLRSVTWHVKSSGEPIRLRPPINDDMKQFAFMNVNESKTFKCENSADGCVWYANGEEVSRLINYKYVHDGKDKIIQYIPNFSTLTFIWTIFTVDTLSGKKEDTETETEIELGTNYTFRCPDTDITTAFPVPMIIWKFDENDIIRLSPAKIPAEEKQFQYVRQLKSQDAGNWTCYVAYGSWEAVSSVEGFRFIVGNKIKNFEGIPTFWYEYFKRDISKDVTQEVNHDAGIIYYFLGEAPKYRCDVLKEPYNSIWWYIDGKFYKEKDTFLRLIDSSSPDSLTYVTGVHFTVDNTDFDGSNRLVNQTITLEKTDAQNVYNVTCFLFGFTEPQTFAQMEAMLRDGRDVFYKRLLTKVVSHMRSPIIKGPLSVIQAPDKDIQLTCYHLALPPAYVSFHYKSNALDAGVNITAMMTKNDAKYSRYSIHQENENKTVLTIERINKLSDAGNYTCYSTNRQFGDDNVEKGPTAQLIIEEKCIDGAMFCFNFTNKLSLSLWHILVTVLFIFL